MINGFIPPRAKIASFYVPFYSPDTDEVKTVLLVRGDHYFINDGKVELKFPDVKDSQGVIMDPDVNFSKFFKFLDQHA